MLCNHDSTPDPAGQAPQNTHSRDAQLLDALYGQRLAKAATQPDPILKTQVRNLLGLHFDLQEEVTGDGPMGQRVKIDFWCFPKPVTVARNWPPFWFGIEVKGAGLQDQRKKTTCRLLYQAASYRLSQFPTPEGPRYPYLVLIFPDFARIVDGPDIHQTIGKTLLDGYALALAKAAGMWRVCELVIPTEDTFEIYIHGRHRWFSSRWGRSTIDYLGAQDNHASR